MASSLITRLTMYCGSPVIDPLSDSGESGIIVAATGKIPGVQIYLGQVDHQYINVTNNVSTAIRYPSAMDYLFNLYKQLHIHSLILKFHCVVRYTHYAYG